jgi:LPS O-antigen subunit length determinant protein (WzzB/FepE family)
MAQPQSDNQNQSIGQWADTDEIDLMSLVATIWRGRGWIVLAAAIAVFIGSIEIIVAKRLPVLKIPIGND